MTADNVPDLDETVSLGAPEAPDGFARVYGTGSGDPPGALGAMAAPASVALVDGEVRFRYHVRAIKIPQSQRVVARELMPGDTDAEIAESAAARGFVDALGADCPDDDPMWPVGSEVFYELMLTEAEARRERDAENVISCEISPRIEAI